MKLSVVYLGTPEFAVPSLDALHSNPSFNVIAVITQSDKPAGRGRKLTAPAVKKYAEEHDIPVFQPRSLKSLSLSESNGTKKLASSKKSCKELVSFLNEASPVDVFATAAYGKIIPPALLEFPTHGIINVHPSLLPRWRGAAPIQHAVFAGDAETGVAIMDVEEGLDTGGVYAVEKIAVSTSDDVGLLHDKLAGIGADLLAKCLPEIVEGSLTATTQEESKATYAEKWEREDCTINWQEPADVCLRRIKASSPIPGARTTFEGDLIKVYDAKIVRGAYDENTPGTIVECTKSSLVIACGDNSFLSLTSLQFPGKKRLAIADLLRGHAFNREAQFGNECPPRR